LGAAGLAGITGGVWPDAEAFIASAGAPDHFRPGDAALAASVDREGWARAIHAARAWAAPDRGDDR
ncbi:MAG: hypothetical protein RQ745_09605, partial [Longimicrobiales bacterium]|nr:hypothetical protein [Longimicrobiales bacterium]